MTTKELISELSRLESKKKELNDKRSSMKDDKKYFMAMRTLNIAIGDRLKADAKDEHDPALYQKAGDYIKQAIEDSRALGDYREAAKLGVERAKIYESELETLKDYPSDELVEGRKVLQSKYLEGLANTSRNEARKDRRKAALYEVTENMNPLRRALVRKSRLRHLALFAALTLICASPQITGNVVGSASAVLNILGVIFLILTLVAAFFLVDQQRLSREKIN